MGKSGNRVVVARIGAASGVAGAVKLKIFTQDPLAFAEYGPLTDEIGRRFEIESLRRSANGVVAEFTHITNREAARELTGTLLYVERASLPETADPDEYYCDDLAGLDVVTAQGTSVGRIVAVHDFGAGDVVEIAFAEGGTEMFAFTRANFPEIDLGRGIVKFARPGTVEAREEGREL